jgi:hypothetical protein
MVKFKTFLNDLFESGLKQMEVKNELCSYFKALDLGYRDKILKL